MNKNAFCPLVFGVFFTKLNRPLSILPKTWKQRNNYASYPLLCLNFNLCYNMSSKSMACRKVGTVSLILTERGLQYMVCLSVCVSTAMLLHSALHSIVYAPPCSCSLITKVSP